MLTLTASGCAERRKRLWDAVGNNCDLLILTDPQSLIRFANVALSPFVFRSNEAAAALVLRPDHATLIGDNLLRPFLEEGHVDEVVSYEWYSGKRSAGHRRSLLMSTLSERLAPNRPRRIGAEASSLAASVAESIRPGDVDPSRFVVDLDPIVRQLRRSKDADEIELMRRSITAGEAGLKAAQETVEPGMTELDVYLIVQEAAIRSVGEPAIVYGDFASGPRCWIDRGGPPTHRSIEAGDLLLIDYSVVVRGYRGDFTNTFVVGGEPTAAQADLARACLEALAAGEAALRPNVPARDVDRALRHHLARLGLDQFYPSHGGHGLGLGHPDPPYIVPDSTDTILPGDIVALEPGLYVPDVGGMRFERNYLITADGFETLTHHSLSLSPR
jgi:Xaa-Pro aminopeptidase